VKTKRFFLLIITGVLILPLLCSCKKTFHCTHSGELSSMRIELKPVKRVETCNNIELHVVQDPRTFILVRGGREMLPHFSYLIENGKLVLDDAGKCIFRGDEYKIEVTLHTPDLREIRNSANFGIYSSDTLKFEELRLISENYHQPESPAAGDFDLIVKTNYLEIISNNLSMFSIKGETQQLRIGFYSGMSKFMGKNLRAERIYFLQRSVNDLELFPLHDLKGHIYSTGNVLIFNEPDSIQVTQHYTGSLICKY